MLVYDQILDRVENYSDRNFNFRFSYWSIS